MADERVPIAGWTDIERRFVMDYRAKLVEFMGAQDELLELANDPEHEQGSLEAAEHLVWMFRND